MHVCVHSVTAPLIVPQYHKLIVLAVGGASSAPQHQESGLASWLGHVSMGREQRAECSGSLVVEVQAAVLLKSGSSPSRVVEANVGRICKTIGVWIGVQPVAPSGTAPWRPSMQHLACKLGALVLLRLDLGSKMYRPWVPAHR